MNDAMYLRIFAVVTVALAGYVRGYGGFGFSMITVAALSLAMPPERKNSSLKLEKGLPWAAY